MARLFRPTRLGSLQSAPHHNKRASVGLRGEGHLAMPGPGACHPWLQQHDMARHPKVRPRCQQTCPPCCPPRTEQSGYSPEAATSATSGPRSPKQRSQALFSPPHPSLPKAQRARSAHKPAPSSSPTPHPTPPRPPPLTRSRTRPAHTLPGNPSPHARARTHAHAHAPSPCQGSQTPAPPPLTVQRPWPRAGLTTTAGTWT